MSKFDKDKSVTVQQILSILSPGQEVQIMGRNENIKTGIETARYISKTEKVLLNEAVQGLSIKDGDTYLIIKLVRI